MSSLGWLVGRLGRIRLREIGDSLLSSLKRSFIGKSQVGFRSSGSGFPVSVSTHFYALHRHLGSSTNTLIPHIEELRALGGRGGVYALLNISLHSPHFQTLSRLYREGEYAAIASLWVHALENGPKYSNLTIFSLSRPSSSSSSSLESSSVTMSSRFIQFLRSVAHTAEIPYSVCENSFSAYINLGESINIEHMYIMIEACFRRNLYVHVYEKWLQSLLSHVYKNIQLDTSILTLCLYEYSLLKQYEYIEKIWKLAHTYRLNDEIHGEYLYALLRCGHPQQVVDEYVHIHNPNALSMNAAICAYIELKRVDKVVEMIRKMTLVDLKIESDTWKSLFSHFATMISSDTDSGNDIIDTCVSILYENAENDTLVTGLRSSERSLALRSLLLLHCARSSSYSHIHKLWSVLYDNDITSLDIHMMNTLLSHAFHGNDYDFMLVLFTAICRSSPASLLSQVNLSYFVSHFQRAHTEANVSIDMDVSSLSSDQLPSSLVVDVEKHSSRTRISNARMDIRRFITILIQHQVTLTGGLLRNLIETLCTYMTVAGLRMSVNITCGNEYNEFQDHPLVIPSVNDYELLLTKASEMNEWIHIHPLCLHLLALGDAHKRLRSSLLPTLIKSQVTHDKILVAFLSIYLKFSSIYVSNEAEAVKETKNRLSNLKFICMSVQPEKLQLLTVRRLATFLKSHLSQISKHGYANAVRLCVQQWFEKETTVLRERLGADKLDVLHTSLH